MKCKAHIEIVASRQNRLSPMGRKAREAVQAVLAQHYSDVRITILNTAADLESLVARNPDLVVLGTTKLRCETIGVAGFLELHDIAYTGSQQTAYELGIDKVQAKQRVQSAGLQTAACHVVSNDRGAAATDLPYPVFVKPTDRGGGQGIDSQSIVRNQYELQSKIRSLKLELDAEALVETYLPGREFSVAVLKDDVTAGYAVMPIEIVAPRDASGNRFLGSEVKRADSERSAAMADGAAKQAVCELALDAFLALGARDYGRIDIRMDARGIPHFLEANLLPSLKPGSGNYFPKACRLNLGMSYDQMILRIVQLGLARNQRFEAGNPEFDIPGTLPAFEPAF